MKTLSAAALAAGLFAATLPATAAMNNASVTLAAPLAGATLEAGRVDMSVYYTASKDSAGKGTAFEVVATYVSDTAPAKPLQLTMALADGDNVHFGLPGHPETLFSFARHGNAVTVSSQPAAVPASTGA